MLTSTSTLRVLEPAPNILAFYDGRVANTRLYSDESNWLDNGAYLLGVASYVVYDGNEALVFDTHISIAHAKAIRQALENRGITSIRVVLSHYHQDHVAGNEAFTDCEIIACCKTEQALLENQQAFAAGAPSIEPLVMPTTIFEGEKTLQVLLGFRMAKTAVPQVVTTYNDPLADRMCAFGKSAAAGLGGPRVRQDSSTLRTDQGALADARDRQMQERPGVPGPSFRKRRWLDRASPGRLEISAPSTGVRAGSRKVPLHYPAS